MADPIPAADSALLAAQAKGGQAGVDAYNAAKADLQAQRQQAVQQAMQEAALRGAPAGAVPSISSTITGPYDQGIASLTQSQAAYQADMAARDQRMADYEHSVNAARSFIPQQVEMTVAPIRAQNEFQLSQLRLQGQQRIDEIMANLDLTKADMAARFQAWQIQQQQEAAKAAAEDAKLSQGQLGGMLGAGVGDYLGGLGDKLRADIQSQQGAKDIGTRIGSTLNPFVVGQQKTAQTEGDVKTFAAKLLQAAIQRENDRLAGRSTFNDPTGGARRAVQDIAARAAGRPTEAEQFGPQAQQGYEKILRLLGQAQQSYGQVGQIGEAAGERNIVRGPAGILSPRQLGRYSTEEQNLIAGAPGGFETPEDVGTKLLGQPYQAGINPTTGRPEYGTNPYAGTAAQFAAQIAAQRLREQGYDFTDADVANALGYDQLIKPGMTAYDIQQSLTGQPTAGEEITGAESDDKAAEAQAAQDTRDRIAAMDAATKANEEASRQDYNDIFHVDPPESLGTPSEVMNIVDSLGDKLDAAISMAQTELTKVRKEDTFTQSDEEDAIRKAVAAAGITGGDIAAYRIIRDLLL